MAHTLFLINPYSAKVRRMGFDVLEKEIRKVYKSAGRTVDVRKIDFELLDVWLKNAESEGIKNVFAVGGDGTVNAVGAKVIHTSLNFGIIPLGSGNGLARAIGYSTLLPISIRQSITNQVIEIDTATFGTHSFLNVGGVGIDADVASRFKHSKMRGPLPYIYQALITFFTYKPDSYTLEIDNQVLHLPQAHLISFSNGTQWGYDAHVTPEARLSDGWLNVVILKHLSIWNFPRVVMSLFLGENYRPKDIERYVCKTGKITRSKAGDAQVDGEHILESQTIEVKIQEKSLRLLLPNTLTQDKIDAL